jgi:hypothetical protein
MPNTNPFRLEVLLRLSALLATINTSSGYLTTIPASSILRGRAVYGDADPLPMLTILEPPIPVDLDIMPNGAEASSGFWQLMIQGFVEDDHKNPTDPAHKYVADVRAVLAKHKTSHQSVGKLGFGSAANTVEDIFIGDPKVRPSDDISSKAYFWMPISLKVVENLANPLTYRSAA